MTMKQVQDADIRLLRVFDAIVCTGSFSAAQSVLNISAPTISEHMTRLETRLGVKLCERGRSGFRLTEAGKQVYAASKQLFNSLEDFRLQTSGIHQNLHGELRLGIIDNTITNPKNTLCDAIRDFYQQAPEVTLQLCINSPHQLEQDVLNGQLHAAIGPFNKRIPGLSYVHLYTEIQRLYCSHQHHFYSQPKVTSTEIKNANIVARTYMHNRDMKSLNAEKPAALIDNVEAQAMQVLSSLFIGFLPEHYAEHWVTNGQLRVLEPHTLTSKFQFILKSGSTPPIAVSAFLNTLKEQQETRSSPCELNGFVE